MDFRAKEVEGRKYKHGKGVEDIKSLPNGNGFISVGGYSVII